MPNDIHKDLETGAAHGASFTEGLNQYLGSKGKSLSDYERKRNSHLGSQVGAGLTGLEYLTGAKAPEVETFFDKHPVQAVTRDTANNAPYIGAGVAALGAGHNLYKDMRNSHRFDKIEDTLMNGKPGKGEEGRMGSGSGFGSSNGHERFSKILDKMPMRGGDNEEYARFVETNLPKVTGNKPVELGGHGNTPDMRHLEESITKHLGGNQERARDIVSIMKQRTGNNSIRGMAEHHFGEGAASYIPEALGKHRVSPGLLRGISRVKGPALLGGGIALGGAALSEILKSIHQHTYGDEKIKDWTNNMRMVKGKFDELER